MYFIFKMKAISDNDVTHLFSLSVVVDDVGFSVGDIFVDGI